jgi:hypothetical protein
MHDDFIMHRFTVLNNHHDKRHAIPQKPMTTTIILILDRRRMKKGELYPICRLLNHKNTKLYINMKDNVAEAFWAKKLELDPTLSFNTARHSWAILRINSRKL